MKLTILAIMLVAVAFISIPSLTNACPPPPAPGYDGGPVGEGTNGGDGTAPKMPGGKDYENGVVPGDVSADEEIC